MISKCHDFIGKFEATLFVPGRWFGKRHVARRWNGAGPHCSQRGVARLHERRERADAGEVFGETLLLDKIFESQIFRFSDFQTWPTASFLALSSAVGRQFVCICTGNSTKNWIVSSQLLKRARATPQQAPRWSPGGPGAPRRSQLTSGLKTRIFAQKSPKWRYRAQKSLKMHAYTMTPLVQVTSLSDEKCDCIRSFSGVSALIQTL